MLDLDRVETLVDAIVTVSNTSKELGIDLREFCDQAIRSVVNETEKTFSNEIHMIISSYRPRTEKIQ